MKKTILKTIIISLFSLLCFICIIFMFYVIDAVAFNYRYSNLLYGKDKEFKVPKTFKLVYDGKYYAIKITDRNNIYDGYFLDNGRYRIVAYHPSVGYCTFIDSANAKAYLKYYIKQEQKRNSSGKEFQ